MRWAWAGKASVVAVALIGSSEARAQATWWNAVNVGVASTISSGQLPGLALGVNLGANVVESSRLLLRANLAVTSPLLFAGSTLCLSETECIEQRGAAQVGTLTGDVGFRPGGRTGRMLVFGSVGAYRANPWHHDSRNPSYSEPTSNLVAGGGVEWRLSSFSLTLRYLNYSDVFNNRAEALGISFSRQFRLK